jgi:hypothetical protein
MQCLVSSNVSTGSKFRFQLSQSSLLACISVCGKPQYSQLGSSFSGVMSRTAGATSPSNGGKNNAAVNGNSIAEYFDFSSQNAICQCSVEFTSLINIAIVREKILPLILNSCLT